MFFLAECATHIFFFLGDGNGQNNLGSMSVEALLKLRDDIGKVLSQKAVQLEEQLSRLGGEAASTRGRGSAMKGRKVPIKYRDKGATPGQAEERSPSGCERSSRPVRNSKTLPFKRQRLLAKLPREKQRNADAKSDEVYPAAARLVKRLLAPQDNFSARGARKGVTWGRSR